MTYSSLSHQTNQIKQVIISVIETVHCSNMSCLLYVKSLQLNSILSISFIYSMTDVGHNSHSPSTTLNMSKLKRK